MVGPGLRSTNPQKESLAKIIVFGANGRTGRIIVAKALEAGHEVTAAVRNPEAFSDFHPSTRGSEKLHVVKADVNSPASVHAAVRGMNAAISAIGTGRKPNGLYSNGTRVIVNALIAEHVQRFICISSGGVYHDDPNLLVQGGRKGAGTRSMAG